MVSRVAAPVHKQEGGRLSLLRLAELVWQPECGSVLAPGLAEPVWRQA